MNDLFARALVRWLPLVVALSGLFLFSYWAVQQDYRVSANDPQIQMAEDAAAALATDAPVSQVVPAGSVDLRASLAPWLVVYDASGKPLAASGELDGALPQLPAGVFDPSTWHTYAEYGVPLAVPSGEDRFSWQPRSDVRQAVVLVHASNGDFVAAGRSMREVENREATLTHGAAILWAASALGSLIIIILELALGWL